MNTEIRIEGWKYLVLACVVVIILVLSMIGAANVAYVFVGGAERAQYGNRITAEWEQGGVVYFQDESGRQGRFFKPKRREN